MKLQIDYIDHKSKDELVREYNKSKTRLIEILQDDQITVLSVQFNVKVRVETIIGTKRNIEVESNPSLHSLNQIKQTKNSKFKVIE